MPRVVGQTYSSVVGHGSQPSPRRAQVALLLLALVRIPLAFVSMLSAAPQTPPTGRLRHRCEPQLHGPSVVRPLTPLVPDERSYVRSPTRRRVLTLTALTAVTVVTGSIAVADGPSVSDLAMLALSSRPEAAEVEPTDVELLAAGTPFDARGARIVAHPVRSERIAVADTATMFASWYGPGFHGRLTANGETFDQDAMTAAHKTLPFGTVLRVTNPANGRRIVVRINDRGPFIAGRDIDLSRGAARALGIYGVSRVETQEL
jgi:rare lipoprotein A